ncbi:conserved hypothetical protein [Microsporum canis CBS 113480]|uniref:C2H2-type domain-containing protein n=1 Tax=Arthroderma otae (strain ATCC MYA-4605 / CBS 113480) TaxID=554155 RepID=C5FMA3_ARTOC|nr:conserved hypothetical protein [Microsporum canis CBS 113480]EEQ31006.1 conserved hypothetical protein [Microsporum canis CBS 113480]
MAPAASSSTKKASMPPERKYKCQFCHRAFSRSEHRSRHERSHTKERPFKCLKCRSTFVRRDLLLRHDRTVHAKDGGIPLVAEGRRRGGKAAAAAAAAAATNANANTATAPQTTTTAAKASPPKSSVTIDPAALEQIEASSDGMVDLETAAMLMTDFQHKAAAAVTSSQHHNHGHAQESFADRASLMEPSVSYMSGNATLPQMPWDTFMADVKPTKESRASQPVSSYPSTLQHQTLVAPTIERSASSDNLTPTMHSLVHSLPVSGNSTPNALSPYPSMTGPVSPVNYRRSPGPSQILTQPKTPQISSDAERQAIVDRLESSDNMNILPETFKMPSTAVMNRYLSTYFNMYHHHLPFLHPATFTPKDVSSPLLLAVLSIGALYTFEREDAFMLHIGSKMLVNQFLQQKDNFDSRKCPLWAMQSTLLNMIFESWSGDSKGLEWTCSIKSLLANMVAGNRYQLKLRIDAREGSTPRHAEWIEDESCRRTYYAVFVFFGMLSLTFNHNPALTFNEFDTLELPSSESLWNLEISNEYTWRRALGGSSKILTSDRPTTAFYAASHTPQKGHPLIFNSMAVYRNTRARLEVDLKSIQEALRYHSPYEVAAAMTVAREKIKRSQEMNKVVTQCFECIEIAAVQGLNWVATASATNWSIEHPLCGMDMMVILSLWLYRLEHDEEQATEDELELYYKIRGLFTNELVDQQGKVCSTVARVWGNILDGVVVWGITKLMGEAFKLHSQALVGYQDAVASPEQALEPMPIKGLASVGTAY